MQRAGSVFWGIGMLFEAVSSDHDEGAVALDGDRPRPCLGRDVSSGTAVTLRYRPVVVLESGAVGGLEAVLTGPPSEIDETTNAVLLAEACVEARYWPGCRIAVQASVRELASGALLDEVDAALAVSGLAPWLFEVELAEADRPTAPLAAFRALRARGIGAVLAGFGAGDASLALLQRLPWTAVKLDRHLVGALPLDASACTRARNLLEAALTAGLRPMADGLETLAQRDMLIRLGCREATGPLYSRALPPERLAALLDYRVDTCSASRGASETLDDRVVPH